MATKKRTNTLSDAAVADLNKLRRVVLAKGASSGATQPYDVGEQGTYWLKITTSTVVATNQWDYTCELHRSPFSTSPLSAGLFARNTWETGATASLAAGYTLSPGSSSCGAFLSIAKIPDGTWHRAEGRYFHPDDEEWRYVFSERNDPVIGS